MSITYNPENDPYAVREVSRDFGKLIIDNQVLGPNPYKRHYLNPIAIEEAKNKQIVAAFAFCNPGFYITALSFLYFGGLYQARKQFINGGDYFLNAKFNYIKGSKWIFLNFLVGAAAGVYLFGDRKQLNDYINTKLSSLHSLPSEKRPYELKNSGVTAAHNPEYNIFDGKN